MPNHAENHVVIVGPGIALEQISAALVRTGPHGSTRIDFNGLIPMPPELRDTVSPTVWVDTQEEADAINADWRSAEPGGPTVRAITRAEAGRRLDAYGAANWHEWAVQEWGTKWNASGAPTAQIVESRGGNCLRLTFTTAWCAPTPVFAAIESRWPGVRVHAITLNEDPPQDESYGEPFDWMDVDRVVRFY